MRRRLLAAALAAASFGAAAPAATAATETERRVPLLGISDQKPSTFTDPRFEALGLRLGRLVLPWDAIFTEPARVDRWMQAAGRAGVWPLIAFSAGTGSRCPFDPCVLPQPRELLAAFEAFRAAYPYVAEFQTWNEANHESQPTRHRPKQTARLHDALRRRCPGCRIVAASVLGDDSMVSWVKRFRRAARVEPELWGLHNYRDVNDRTGKATRALLRLVRGPVWFTETGGIVRFTARDGRLLRPHDEERAARAVNRALDLGKRHVDRVERIYLYNWRAGPSSERFDSGMIGPDGRARLAFRVLWRRVQGSRPYPDDVAEPGAVPAPRIRLTRTGAVPTRRSITAPRGRAVWVPVRCRHRRSRCLGMLTLSTAKHGRIGGGAFAVRPGGRTKVRVMLSRSAAGWLRRSRRSTAVTAKLRMRTPSGAVARRTHRLRILASRAARR